MATVGRKNSALKGRNFRIREGQKKHEHKGIRTNKKNKTNKNSKMREKLVISGIGTSR